MSCHSNFLSATYDRIRLVKMFEKMTLVLYQNELYLDSFQHSMYSEALLKQCVIQCGF